MSTDSGQRKRRHWLGEFGVVLRTAGSHWIWPPELERDPWGPREEGSRGGGRGRGIEWDRGEEGPRGESEGLVG